MIHDKVELSGSFRPELSASDAYVISNSSVQLPWTEIVEAVGLLKHKQGLKPEKCIGFRVSDSKVTLLFEK